MLNESITFIKLRLLLEEYTCIPLNLSNDFYHNLWCNYPAVLTQPQFYRYSDSYTMHTHTISPYKKLLTLLYSDFLFVWIEFFSLFPFSKTYPSVACSEKEPRGPTMNKSISLYLHICEIFSWAENLEWK